MAKRKDVETNKRKTVSTEKAPVNQKAQADKASKEPAAESKAAGSRAVKPAEVKEPTVKAPAVKADKPAEKAPEAKAEELTAKAPAMKKAETPAVKRAETPAAKEPAAKVEKPATKAPEVKAEEPTAKASTAKADEAVAKAPEVKAEKPTVKVPEVKAEKPATKATKAKAEKPAEKAPEVKAEEPTAKAPATKAEEPVAKAPVAKADKPAAKAAEVKADKPAAKAPEAEAEEPVAKAPAAKAESPEAKAEASAEPAAPEAVSSSPRRSVAFIGSECYPFVKTGGLGDVMYALPKALVKQNCDVKVILPRYRCIPWEYQEKMIYRGAFNMDLCADGRSYYVGIMEYVWDGVVYDFIDNEEFFNGGNPYTNLVDDIPRYCYFAKAALAALNYMDWIPNIIHCHDWQAALVPVYLRTLFAGTKLTTAETVLTIHNLRFQGIYNIPTIRYWTGLPDFVFNKDALKTGYQDANMMKGGLAYANAITTVSPTYAGEIQTPCYGEGLDAHLRYHAGKLRGIVNGIDYDIWDASADTRLEVNYDLSNVLAKKKENKVKLQEELGLERDEGKFVIGLISRLTDQKGLDLVNAILPQVMDGNTQVVVLGTGDRTYEDSFRYYEGAYRGSVCSNIMYDETRAHRIYAGADALLVPSRFEPCGLTQLIAMHYGTVPIVRETGGLKDTVEPYNMFSDSGNGFTFDRYDAGLLLDAINRAKTLYFEHRDSWDGMVRRDMEKDLSWELSARQYKDLYLDLTR